MRLGTAILGLILLTGVTSKASAQFPAASKEHKILKLEEGKWDAAVTMFMGPEGPYDPPVKSKGSETNRMVGDFWLVSDFKGNFEGLEFTGHAQFGYDAKKKKYVGSWIDSFSANATHMEGTYDAEKKTMTYHSSGMNPDGTPTKGKNVVVYGKDKRVMTMYYQAPDSKEMVKVMEIVYTPAK